MTPEQIKKLPKPELHRHLEGCVRTETIIDIARASGLKLPTADKKALDEHVKVRRPLESLEKVLEAFTIAQSVFVSYEAVERITQELLEDALNSENVRLLELRYSPEFMLGRSGLDWQKAFDVVRDTTAKFEKKNRMVCGIILIASRCYGPASAEKTAAFAAENKKHVIGFDLADSESNWPSSLFVRAVEIAQKSGLPVTVHSGEEGDPGNMRQTINLLSPARVGHGVKAAEDKTGAIVDLVKKKNITLETNPWSNYLTRAVQSVEAHPLKFFLSQGVRAVIGADDPQVLDTDLNHEYELCVSRMGLGREDIEACRLYALQGSFLEKDKKQEAARLLGLEGALKA
ncbi:MAG TPA: adenosine deaminase [Elusimicrobiales bacterium]|nr:adenosine deaminase [Elusimicrobiales bacterium]